MSIREFEPLTIIGRGAFGEVRVCRQKSNGNIVAIKKMKKEDMLKKNQLMHVRTEKEILKYNNPWIVKLNYAFQDDFFLYLVMDFLPGGDLMNLLMKKDILTEEEARFYTAEMILAVESIHKLNCIHRDLKPDNILIDKRGHIQLSDFGLSKLADKIFFPISIKDKYDGNFINEKNDNITIYSNIEKNKEKNEKNEKNENSINENPINSNIETTKNSSNKILNQNFEKNEKNDKNDKNEIKKTIKKKPRLLAYSTVGTPDYIAPEVFGQEGYSEEVDWWSIGVMFFEMVVGYPPFFSENPTDTCKKIVRWKQYFQIPDDVQLSKEAKNLIQRMVSSHENRLGVNGVEEIKNHPFFKGVDWDNIRNTRAPFIPDIKNEWDCKYFDHFPEQEPFYPPEKKGKKRKDIYYSGYTFNRDFDNMKEPFEIAIEVLDIMKKNIQDKKNKVVIEDKNDDFEFIGDLKEFNKGMESLEGDKELIKDKEKDDSDLKDNYNGKDEGFNERNIKDLEKDDEKEKDKEEDNDNNKENKKDNDNNKENKKDNDKEKENKKDNDNNKENKKDYDKEKEKDNKNENGNKKEKEKEKENNINKNNINIELNKHYISNTNVEKKDKNNIININNSLNNNNSKVNHQILITQPLVNRINFNGALKYNTVHKKISKSPELKNINLKESQLTTIKIKSSRDIIVNKISPGKNLKEKTPLFTKLKVNLNTNLLNKKPIKNHFNIYHCKTIENKSVSPKQNLDMKKKKNN